MITFSDTGLRHLMDAARVVPPAARSAWLADVAEQLERRSAGLADRLARQRAAKAERQHRCDERGEIVISLRVVGDYPFESLAQRDAIFLPVKATAQSIALHIKERCFRLVVAT